MLQCEGIGMCYGDSISDTWVLKDISLTLEAQSFMAIMGRSGAGKSTLLQIMGTLLKPTAGVLTIDGMDIYQLNTRDLQRFRRRELGFIFQDYRLIPEYTVWENICMPLAFDHAEIDKEYLIELMKTCEILGKADAFPDRLSGGEKQRVALVRAMAAKPSIILADEPTGNLDYQSGMNVIKLLRDCRERYQQTIVMVTHDEECAAYADQVLQIRDGVIC